MTPVVGLLENQKNQWYFSPCSIRSFKSKLIMGGVVNTQVSCLKNVPKNLHIETTYDKTPYLPGQLWNVDQQCQMTFDLQESSATACGVIYLLLKYLFYF